LETQANAVVYVRSATAVRTAKLQSHVEIKALYVRMEAQQKAKLEAANVNV